MNLSLNSTLDEVFHTLWEAIDLSSMNCSVFAHYFSARDNIVYAQEFWLNAINLNGENRSLLANEYNILQSNSNWLEFDKWNVQFKSTENLDRLNATISSGRCAKTICKTLEWRGSADITGIGAVASYFVLAALTTFFTMFNMYYKRSKKASENRWLYSLHKVTPIFNDTALFLCSSISIAMLYTSFSSASLSDLSSLFFIGLFAFFCQLAAVVRDSAKMGRGERHVLRTRDGLVLCFVGLALFFVSWTKARYRFKSLQKQSRGSVLPEWDHLCFAKAVLGLESLRTVAFVPLFFFGVFPVVMGWLSYAKSSFLNELFLDYICSLATASMWTLLGFIMVYRGRAQEWSGDTNEDGQWGFGQVLALAAWLNVVVHFYANYLYGWHKRKDSEELEFEE